MSGQETMAEAKQRLAVAQWVEQGPQPVLRTVLSAVAGAASQIAKRIRLAGLEDGYGAAGATNVQGEQQQKLDVFANDLMLSTLRGCEAIAGVVSEENEAPVVFSREDRQGKESFVLCMDPLDGSSNIDVNVNVGTIFGIWRHSGGDLLQSALQTGARQVAAGYVVYGPSVVMVVTVGDGVAAFTLGDEGSFVQSGDRLRMPEQGIYYSANEGNSHSWPAPFRGFIPQLLRGELGGAPFSARYVGSLVADFHRTLLKGGVFLYPPTEKAKHGKLRLQYEANPLAMIAEQAGGMASDGHGRILEIRPTTIHERTALAVGSRREVELLERLVREAL